MRVRFGDCVFDAETRELLRSGSVVHVAPKTLRLLEVLLERRPKAVAKDELFELLWPGVFVADGNLARVANELREAIGDDAHKPRFIRTVHGFGYAFSGPAAKAAAPRNARPSAFRILRQDREVSLDEGENILGRDEDAAVWIDVNSVSRHHARILVAGDQATLEDLESKNGTFLNGKPVKKAARLSDGDRIRVGTVEVVFHQYRSGVSTETARSR
ncbi:MAG TPA: FHA domain-containing protein [Thermoanaerobaculia bacterium]|nr:FHA domain-containing protein [Thermoanaerobaculia bacterium]